MENEKLPRAYNPADFGKMKFKLLDFSEPWKSFIGKPELSGAWIVGGNSSMGKTSFMAQLIKYLTNFEKCAYNSIEEGVSESLRIAFERENMQSVGNSLMILNKEPIDVLKKRLHRKKSPKVIAIDSVQYTGLTKRTYKELLAEFPTKLFIFTSHAAGQKVKGDLAESIWYDADVKIWVEGFRAVPNSRFGGSEIYTIWQEGAEKYWGAVD